MSKKRKKHRPFPGERKGSLGSDFDRRPWDLEISDPSEPEPKRPLIFLAGYEQLLESWAIMWDEELARGILGARWMISTYQGLPKLRGFWPLSSSDAQYGDFYDLSGQGRTLSNAGAVSVVQNIYAGAARSAGGATGYLYRLDERPLNWDGLSYGITILAYVYPDVGMTGTSWGPIVCKGTSVHGTEYAFRMGLSSNKLHLRLASANQLSSLVLTRGQWNFVAVSYDRTTHQIIFQLNDEKEAITIPDPGVRSVPAANFEVGQWQGASTDVWDGNIAMLAVCDGVVPDVILQNAFDVSRHVFGV